MSKPKMYTWRDDDAPVLDETPGSLVQVLRKCMVEGYGAGDQQRTPPGAGWEMQADNPATRAAFRSLNPDAAGHWYYIDDTGDFDGANNDGLGPRLAALLGAAAFSGWDADTGAPGLQEVFGDQHTTLGAQMITKSDTSGSRPWLIVADDRTVYWFCDVSNTHSRAWSDETIELNMLRYQREVAFGDYLRFSAHAQGVTPHGIVCGDNRGLSTGNSDAGSLMGYQIEGWPATSDSVSGTGPAPAAMARRWLYPTGSSTSLSSTFSGPLPYTTHWVGQRWGSAGKGYMRGLRVAHHGHSYSSGIEAVYPDPSKLYGTITLPQLGEVHYICGHNGNGHTPLAWLRTDWDNEG